MWQWWWQAPNTALLHGYRGDADQCGDFGRIDRDIVSEFVNALTQEYGCDLYVHV